MAVEQILIDGKWISAAEEARFQAVNPATGETLAMNFPISGWADCDRALTAAADAATALKTVAPEQLAGFLEA